MACNARSYSQSLSEKMAALDLLKIKISWNKDYDVTTKILSGDWNYIVDVAMWKRFGNSSIAMREVIITSS